MVVSINNSKPSSTTLRITRSKIAPRISDGVPHRPQIRMMLATNVNCPTTEPSKMNHHKANPMTVTTTFETWDLNNAGSAMFRIHCSKTFGKLQWATDWLHSFFMVVIFSDMKQEGCSVCSQNLLHWHCCVSWWRGIGAGGLTNQHGILPWHHRCKLRLRSKANARRYNALDTSRNFSGRGRQV